MLKRFLVVVALSTAVQFPHPEALRHAIEPEIEVIDGSGTGDPFAGWKIEGDGTKTGNLLTAGEDDTQAETDVAPASGPPPVCVWTTLDEPESSSRWAGQSPLTGRLESMNCGATTDDGTGMGSAMLEVRFVPNATPLPPQPPDPAVLAVQAYRELRVPAPTIGAGPQRAALAVNLWTWLWIDNPGPLTVTVAAGGVSVTATATITSTTWTLGEPAATDTGYVPGAPVTVTCQGTGTQPPANYDWKAEPPCGHMYQWRSLKERTNGTGTWPVSATSTWTVTWQSNTGVTGGTTLAATSNDAFDIGEYRTLLVQNPGG